MPRYYFDARDSCAFFDPEGSELADIAAAKREAFEIFSQLLPGKESHVLDSGPFTVTLLDENRLVLMTLEVAATLSPTNKGG